MDKQIKILGNSVAVKVRPDEGGLTYSELLAEAGYEVENKAVPASMVGDHQFTSEELDCQKSCTWIIHFGIVEASSRSLPRGLYTFMMQEYKTLGKIKAMGVLLLRKFESMFRTHLVKLRGSTSWMPMAEFERRYREVLSLIIHDHRVICVGINHPSKRIENHLPGTTVRSSAYNEKIRELSEEAGAIFINIRESIAPEDVPDGVHFNARGHQILTDMIKRTLDK